MFGNLDYLVEVSAAFEAQTASKATCIDPLHIQAVQYVKSASGLLEHTSMWSHIRTVLGQDMNGRAVNGRMTATPLITAFH